MMFAFALGIAPKVDEPVVRLAMYFGDNGTRFLASLLLFAEKDLRASILAAGARFIGTCFDLVGK
jgi:hypothetical protein